MSSRNRVIHSITLSLLLFGQCCWSLWIRSPDTSPFNRNLLVDNNNNNLDFSSEIEVGPKQLQFPPPQMPRSHQQPRDSIGPVTQQQVLEFLHDNALEQRVHAVSSNLRSLLKENNEGDLPIVYEEDGIGMGEDTEDVGDADTPNGNNNALQEDIIEYEINENGDVELSKDKRSGRYYRRYPFKRRNNRYYEHPTHNCKPSREEVVKLLIALHKYQKGNKDRKMVRFCKRDRPLGNIITNMRFLG